MADQLVNGDDEIKNPAATAESSASEQAHDNLMKDVFPGKTISAAELDKDHSNKPGAGSAGSAADSGSISGKLEKHSQNSESGKTLPNSIEDLIKQGKPGLGDDKGRFKENIKDSDAINKIKDSLADFLKPDGVKQLPTGDHLVREDGKETLFTPNGDKVTVNPDGTFKVKGDVKSVSTDKTGATTITFGDGAKVIIDKEGIRDVSRGNQSVSFPRHHREQFKPWDGPSNGGGHGSPGGGGHGGELPPVIKPGRGQNPGGSGDGPRPPRPAENGSPAGSGPVDFPSTRPGRPGDTAPSTPATGHDNSPRPTGNIKEQFRNLKPVLPNIEIK